MKKILAILTAAGAVACGFTACKTTEANVRSSYERAIAGRDSSTAIENTIYGAPRHAMNSRSMIVAGDTFAIYMQRVAVTEGGGGVRENLKPYSVVVGQFKQRFNAVSMRDRIADAGYPAAFVAETTEPYYYVILGSYADAAAACAAQKAIPADFPVRMKAPLPFILQSSR